MLELRVEKVSFFTALCLQILPVAFDIYIRSKTNVSQVKGKQSTCYFLFFFFSLRRCGRLQMRCGEEEAMACLGKLLMQACFNLRFPDVIGSERREQPTGIDLKSAASAARPRKTKLKEGKSQ